MSESVAGLLDQIECWPTGTPVRLMEQLLEFGEDALPTLLERMPTEDDEDREPLWYLALLAELRSPRAVPTLVERLVNTTDVLLRVVASEALAKVGAAAVPALREVLSDASDDCRLYAYGALGWIEGDAALDVLLDALQRDAPLAHVVANAIGEHQRRDVVPALYDAYQRCEPWQRAELADAIHHLHWGIRHPQPVHSDWRFRYFNCGPPLGVDIGWLGICAILYDDLEHMAAAEHPPLRTLEDIIGTEAEHAHAPEHCEDCGALIEYPTGMPVCPETAIDVVRLQLDHLHEEREHGLDDLFDVLNEVDAELWDVLNAPEPSSKKKRAAQQAQVEELAFLKETCRWCIEHGAETIGPARARLLAEIGRLADQHPATAAAPTPIVRAQPKVGRNDPCPCGSGKKHKNCCLA